MWASIQKIKPESLIYRTMSYVPFNFYVLLQNSLQFILQSNTAYLISLFALHLA